MKILDGGRISIGAMALGMAEGAMKLQLIIQKKENSLVKPISKFQGISFKLADMATEIEASRLLLYKAASKTLKFKRMLIIFLQLPNIKHLK
jgi:alkylation response protein AidB-like acyl-CoA dehydrogenase